MQYDVDYFINKFKAIPKEKWIKGGLFDYPHTGNHCALGHLGMLTYPNKFEQLPKEVQAFVKLTGAETNLVHNDYFIGVDWSAVYSINDKGDTNAKDNVLKFLEEVKAKQEKKELVTI